MDQNSEEVLTRHLLKLSEIEKQFQELTNKFEEINFKIDKLSSRLSKVQADNQLRFQQLEEGKEIGNFGESQQSSSLTSENNEYLFFIAINYTNFIDFQYDSMVDGRLKLLTHI